jgi:hypothetical protein
MPHAVDDIDYPEEMPLLHWDFETHPPTDEAFIAAGLGRVVEKMRAARARARAAAENTPLNGRMDS